MSEPSSKPIETASEPLPEAAPPRNRALVFLGSGVFFFCVAALEIILRGVYFARNRALWLDEAFLALNIVDRDLPRVTRSAFLRSELARRISYGN